MYSPETFPGMKLQWNNLLSYIKNKAQVHIGQFLACSSVGILPTTILVPSSPWWLSMVWMALTHVPADASFPSCIVLSVGKVFGLISKTCFDSLGWGCKHLVLTNGLWMEEELPNPTSGAHLTHRDCTVPPRMESSHPAHLRQEVMEGMMWACFSSHACGATAERPCMYSHVLLETRRALSKGTGSQCEEPFRT